MSKTLPPSGKPPSGGSNTQPGQNTPPSGKPPSSGSNAQPSQNTPSSAKPNSSAPSKIPANTGPKPSSGNAASKPGEVRLKTGRIVDLAVPNPPQGWARPDVMNGRVLPLDLSQTDEDALFRTGGYGALRPLAESPDAVDRRAVPLVILHGIQGHPREFAPIIQALRGSGFQIYAFFYNDFHRRTSLNGDDLADELRSLLRGYTDAPRLAIAAHSLGGIVGRRALNGLALGGIRCPIDMVAIDSPWHGFGGPSDQGIEGFFMDMVRPFMADGLEDMRSGSSLFRGESGSSVPVARHGLFDVELPESMRLHLCFATHGHQIRDYTDDMRPLLRQLVRHYTEARPVEVDSQRMNFWKALRSGLAFADFDAHAWDLARRGSLDEESLLLAFERFYPRFEGDHNGVLLCPDLHRYLMQKLGRSP